MNSDLEDNTVNDEVKLYSIYKQRTSECNQKHLASQPTKEAMQTMSWNSTENDTYKEKLK